MASLSRGDLAFTPTAELKKKQKNLVVLIQQIGAFTASLILTAAAIWLALPKLQNWVLAVPNDRSSHRVPVPQMGGIFVIGVCVLTFLSLGSGVRTPAGIIIWAAVLVPAMALCIIGLMDDRVGLSALTRLVFYAAASFTCVLLLPTGAINLGTGSTIIDRLLAGVFLLSFINITNFMDGIDGIVVVEFVPMLLFIMAGTSLNYWTLGLDVLPAALAGALLGFFVFNRPTARIFLGDAGSVPIGFLVGILLLLFASHVGVIAAALLPLYFLVDGSITLLRRVLRREKIWLAHRQHFYQQAFDAGQDHWSILLRVLSLNLILCALSFVAGVTVDEAGNPLGVSHLVLLALGASGAVVLLFSFSRVQRQP